MKRKVFCGLTSVLLMISATFAQKATFTVQGHARPDLQIRQIKAKVSEDSLQSSNLTFDDILMWVGSGENKAAIVIDWQDEKSEHALVWGYRWDGNATGYDMISAIAKADPRVILLTHETNLGNTVAGIGFNSHLPYQTELVYTAEEGDPVFYKPQEGIVTTDAYNYDNWTCSDAAGLWKSGWYSNGYWSYWVKDRPDDEFVYSGVGSSSRILTDGSIDGWSFSPVKGMVDALLPRISNGKPVLDIRQWEEPTDENSYWSQMYKNPSHQSIVDLPLAIKSENLSIKWEYDFGGYSGQPVIAGDYMYNTSGKKIYKISIEDGSLVAQGNLVASIGFFSMIAYGDGKIFVTLGNGITQAFDAVTLKSLWQSKVEVGGQQLCPVVYHDGYLYTGTWKGGRPATGVFYCLSTKDENPADSLEIKTPVWQSANTGFYWSGGTIVGDYIFVGGDDGFMRSYNRLDGRVQDEWQVAPELETSTIRSGTSYDEKTGRLFFTAKEAQKIYSVKINSDGTFDHESKLATDIAGQATTTPTIYNNRVYATSGTMTSGGGFDVFDATTLKKIYTIDMGGISQSTPVVSTAYADSSNKNKVYIYVCLNNNTGDLVCIEDFEGNTEPIVKYKYQAPKTQYCTHSVVVDQCGTLYYKNDSRGFWALKSRFDIENAELAKKTDTLVIGESADMAMLFEPYFATNQNCSWQSLNQEIATVNTNGKVTALALGQTKITVCTEEGDFRDTCLLTVIPRAVTGISLSAETDTLQIGDSLVLTATIMPENATNKNCTWTSSAPNVASINEMGVVKALSEGQTTITVSTEEGNFTATCKITVSPIHATGGDTTSVESLLPLALSVYPNPTVSEFYIDITEPALIEVFTIGGNLVFRKEAISGLHSFKPERNGFYLIRVSSGKRSSVIRAIKQ